MCTVYLMAFIACKFLLYLHEPLLGAWCLEHDSLTDKRKLDACISLLDSRVAVRGIDQDKRARCHKCGLYVSVLLSVSAALAGQRIWPHMFSDFDIWGCSMHSESTERACPRVQANWFSIVPGYCRCI